MKWPLTIVDTKSGAIIDIQDVDHLSSFLGKKVIEKEDGTIEVTAERYSFPTFDDVSEIFKGGPK